MLKPAQNKAISSKETKGIVRLVNEGDGMVISELNCRIENGQTVDVPSDLVQELVKKNFREV